MEYYHVPVMLKESIEALKIQSDGIYIDGTLGGGGHAEEIAKKLSAGGRLIAIDRDKQAITAAKEKLAPYSKKITFIHSDFKDFEEHLKKLGISGVDGILLDLGVSSFQIDEPTRGFSYMNDGKLDMRMDNTQETSAYEVVNTYSQEKLAQVFFDYGEEPYGRAIASAIIKARKEKPIERTGELSTIIENAIPMKDRYKSGHPAKRVFQAIRIEVNKELEHLERAIKDMVRWLNPRGRLAIISFHSLEDRIIKQTMTLCATDCICSKKMPICACGHKAEIGIISRKPIVASDSEVSRNSRAASAHLRIAQKI